MKFSKSRAYGYEFRSHDGVGLICSFNIYVDDSAEGNRDYRSTKAGVAGYVGPIGVDPLFREEFRRPLVGCRSNAVEGSSPHIVVYRKDGYVLNTRTRMGRGVVLPLASGPICGGCVRRDSHGFLV